MSDETGKANETAESPPDREKPKKKKAQPEGIPGMSYPRNAPEWDNMRQVTRD